MGTTALMVTIGFSIIISHMMISSNDQKMTLSQRALEIYEEMLSRNIAISGVNIALSKFYKDPDWRAGFTSTNFANGDYSVTVTDVGNQVQFVSTGTYAAAQKTIQVSASWQLPLEDFAVFTKGDVNNLTVLDEFGNPDPTLVAENQAELPDLDDQALIDEAIAQDHVEGGAEFIPADGYPNGSFYYSGSTPNITHVQGNLQINGGRTVYGIFVIEGNAQITGNGRLEGVLYMKSSSGEVTHAHGGGKPDESSITGGIVSSGDINGNQGGHISITHDPDYMEKFAENAGVPTERELLVHSWQEY